MSQVSHGRHLLLIIFLFSPLLFGFKFPFEGDDHATKRFLNRYPQNLITFKGSDREMKMAWSGDIHSRPIVFVHGSPGGWDAWIDYLMNDELGKDFQIIAVDRPGYGGSGLGHTERSLEKQSANIFQALQLNQSGLPAILVGHSYGGPVVAKMAFMEPRKIAAVIFVASSVDPDLEFTKWYQIPADWWPIRLIIPTVLRVCNQEIMALKEELLQIKEKWRSLQVPIVTIQGDADNLVPAGNQDFIIKNVEARIVLEKVRVPGMNHFVPWQHPELIYAAIHKVQSYLSANTRVEK